MMNIKQISIEQLYAHPENPRLQLGDLTELADSIKKNGVMQNLTVVPGHFMSKEEWTEAARAEGADKVSAEGSYSLADAFVCDGYTVIIGHRRLAAAKMAGLAELPCVISDMDHREQIATMLEENMQRADLTVYEQAQGFQMMMDLGFTAAEISEKTGFSRTTVDRRLKMAELDRKNLKQAVEMQITIEDLDKLGQIEDVKERNALLARFGENNFDWMVHQTIKKQKADKVRPKAMQMIRDAKVKPIPEKDKYNLYSKYETFSGWRIELDKWDGKRQIVPDTEGELFYRENGTDIEIYKKAKKQKAEPVKKTPEEIAEEKRISLAWQTIDRVQKTAQEMRMAHAKKMKVTPTNAMEMLQWALIAATVMTMGYNTPEKTLKAMAGLEKEYVIPKREKELFKYIHSLPQSRWPELIFLLFEGEESQSGGYAYGSKSDMPRWQECPRISFCYQWLSHFGYRMSTEEEELQYGTHAAFQTKMGGTSKDETAGADD